jgi:hypothetical protein
MRHSEGGEIEQPKLPGMAAAASGGKLMLTIQVCSGVHDVEWLAVR